MARPEYPLAAMVGGERVKLALSLLATDPLLHGLLVSGGRGSGKTLLARGARPLFPAGAPFVEVPPTVTLDRLSGGADWIAALAGGKPRVFKGLIEEAKGGVLFSDHANLLPTAIAVRIANAMQCGGSFIWIASYDPEDGETPSRLRDTFGLHASLDAEMAAEDREMVARRALEFQSAPDEFAARFAGEVAREAERVRAARQALDTVAVDPDSRRWLCEYASRSSVEGNRAEIFAVRAARAHAALCGRRCIDEVDLRVATALVIDPRASAQIDSPQRNSVAMNVPDRGSAVEPKGRSDGPASRMPPIDNPLPTIPLPSHTAGAAASGRGRSRQRQECPSVRGRYVRALPSDPGHGAIAVDATLRAAAPFQASRRLIGQPVRILPSDLRYKQFHRKSGLGIVIALDASGSMANNRIQQAKGAILRLLREAYAHRDAVALVAFRGDRAELLMKLGRSVELASRALDELPSGGGTPLAAGILCALQEARRSASPALLVVLTDGKPNVSAAGEPVWQELERVAEGVRQSEAVPIVIDTNRGQPAGERLARMLGAPHLTLPGMNAEALYRHVSEAASSMR
jgi:magnesium chelatase subunit D